MERCAYCEATFEDEDALVSHLAAEHRSELGPIDERRVEDHLGSDGPTLPTGPLVLGGVVLVAVALTALVVFGLGDGGTTVNGFSVAKKPGAAGSTHEHGTMNVTIDGHRIDFSRAIYQAPGGRYAGRKFHFERGNGRIWHVHADGVTLEYAMATLNIGVSATSVTYEGTTYTDGENADVVVRVDGEPVDPSSYVLHGVPGETNVTRGDHVEIVVRPTG